MIFTYLPVLLLGQLGITLIIYLGAVLINGSFDAKKWKSFYNYNEILNAWRIVMFIAISIGQLITVVFDI